MAQWLKQSTATTIQLGPFLDEDDGKTAEGGLTVEDTDIYLSKNGAAFANPNDTDNAAHDTSGWYRKALDATDTGTLGRLIVMCHEAGALPVWREFMVVPANEFDSLISGSDALDVEVASMAAGTVTAAAVATGAIDADALATDAAQEIRSEIDSNSTQLAAIVADTNELQTDWADGGRLDLLIDAILADTNELQVDDVPGLIAALNDLSAAEVNAEVVDALDTDTYAEPGQGAPAATASLSDKISYLYKVFRNKVTQTSTTLSIYDDAGSTVDQKATVSDDGTTYTRGEIGSGP